MFFICLNIQNNILIFVYFQNIIKFGYAKNNDQPG
ncbi:hypothetical protein GGU45_000332 [Niabella hirudinis]